MEQEEEKKEGEGAGSGTEQVSPATPGRAPMFGMRKRSVKGSAFSVDEFADLAKGVMTRSLFFYALDLKIVRALLLHAEPLVLQVRS
jgi:hypothetical protein